MRRGVAALAIGLASACVPDDEAIRLGSVQFTFTASNSTLDGIAESETLDGWSVHFDRIALGFKTMTIGHIGVTGACSYRGRGETADVVFDPRAGLVQSFNGIEPVICPDVGIIFGEPDALTTLGHGTTAADLVDLASGEPAHAIVEATATHRAISRGGASTDVMRKHLVLRFDDARTSTRFGGCQTITPGGSSLKGVAITASERQERSVRFAAERLFADTIGASIELQVDPFARADADGDGTVTMDELDKLPMIYVGYATPTGAKVTTFGDWVRYLFRFAFSFGEGTGICVGNEPGSDESAGSP